MYVTATSPYILMIILLVRGVTLPGSREGVEFYLKPDAEKLKDINVRTVRPGRDVQTCCPGDGVKRAT